MNKKFFILLIFWWSLIFPNIAYNEFTTDIILENTNLSSNQIIEYDFWIKKLFSTSK